VVLCTVQSYLHMSVNSLKSESLALDLTGSASLSAGREENVNYMLDLSDDADDVITTFLVILALDCCSVNFCIEIKE